MDNKTIVVELSDVFNETIQSYFHKLAVSGDTTEALKEAILHDPRNISTIKYVIELGLKHEGLHNVFTETEKESMLELMYNVRDIKYQFTEDIVESHKRENDHALDEVLIDFIVEYWLAIERKLISLDVVLTEQHADTLFQFKTKIEGGFPGILHLTVITLKKMVDA